MNTLNNILEEYERQEAQLLYNKASEILSLITDEEYEQIIANNKELFMGLSGVHVEGNEIIFSNTSMREAIDIFVNIIKNRKLTKDEFDAMTIDDIKEYICSKLKDKGNPVLLDIIHAIES